MPRPALIAVSIALALSFAAPMASIAADNAPTGFADGLNWRLVGPHRGGWGTVAQGVAGQPDTFYFGAAGGGVWKTVDAGRTWESVFDSGPSSVGALAVAPSDPKVIYAGTGQVTTRYDIAAGEGVFKSIDGGANWQPVGLKDTKYIGDIEVDPRDANVVLVAALGHAFGPNAERGVFRSEDGGRTWTKTLFVSDNTGAVDLAMDPTDSHIVFASTWQMRFKPWLSYFTPDIGPESGVYKSTDGGKTWTRLQGHGFPEGKLGRIGVAATHTPQGTRVWAVVDAEKDGGLYRSDDGGANWQHVNDDDELVNSYFARLTAMPGDPDTVWAVGRSIRRCSKGGAECEIVKGAPGGDDYHDLWINPAHPDHLITASDQGTVVSVDGGATWSSWYNQPTAQLYHLATDNRFPYWIYAGQQDSGTVAIASRSDYGSIDYRDWHPVGAQERDDDVPDPHDPDIVYGSGLGGNLIRWDARNGERQDISPWPVSSYGARPTSVKYHYTWITPIAVSQVAPYPLYQGAQVVFRSTDQGTTWQTISPDLSSKDPARKACEGDLDAAAARACGYGVAFSFGLSPRDNDTIWIGMDDGGVQLTRDAGKSWANVAPKDLPAWARVSSVDASALDDGTAYIAVDDHRQDDFRPLAWRTHDFGKTWTKIVDGLPDGHFLGALRADPKQRGLLYAGTDQGVYVSFDDGTHWRSLQRNLPNAIINDLAVHGDDLIAATQGRSIWILDDVAPLRQLAASPTTGARLFAPATAMRVRANQDNDTPLPREEPAGQNPPIGAVFDYWLPRDAKRAMLIVYDASGKLVRRFASDDPPSKAKGDRYFEARWLKPQPNLSARAGMHRFVWDLRLQRPVTTAYEYSIGAIDGQDTPLQPQGMLIAPGTYQAVLTVDGHDTRQSLVVQADPRVPVDAAAVQSALDLSDALVAELLSHYWATGQIQAVGTQLDEATKKFGNDPAKSAAAKAIADFKAELAPLTSGEGDDSTNLKDIGGALLSLQADLETTDRAPSQPQREVYAGYSARLKRALHAWDEIRQTDLPKLNATLHAAGTAAITIPALADLPAIDPGESRDLP